MRTRGITAEEAAHYHEFGLKFGIVNKQLVNMFAASVVCPEVPCRSYQSDERFGCRLLPAAPGRARKRHHSCALQA